MSAEELPPPLVEALLRLCQGDFSYRLPRTMKRDMDDTVAFFVNTIAEELERILRASREQELRLAATVEGMAGALTRVAGGDFTAQVERDFSGDSADVLAFLVNGTILELGAFVAKAEQRAQDDRLRLERLVRERTAELELLATTDSLTGILNRRRFFEVGEQLRSNCVSTRRPLSVAMVDIDHFKSINDCFGHAVGDLALRQAASIMRETIRQSDHLGRYGGEEFGLLFPGAGLDEAVRVVERVREEIGRRGLNVEERVVTLRVSAGVACWSEGEVFEEMLKRADEALYQAKAQGRDRVVIARSVARSAAQ